MADETTDRFDIDHDAQKKRCRSCGAILSAHVAHAECKSPAEVADSNGDYVWPANATEGCKS